ncbi:hypothetical protein GCM10011575_33070 [Microlunatus endophyticus]|uniref:Uncharacterized protein n=1 Tax=Microlunatus endophyticus TaxID=1716077 RepID=A0A917SCE0_9ACTN|nr:hypothetical protein [Microlunatus endophyticus]GGL72079.1 hypothetical protein GCM10011575_33070 [Microlunatus endophyticus]
MADETVKAWQKIAKQLRGTLPGEWSVARSGVRTLLVRQPIDWVVVWVGISRVRRDDMPGLIGGLTSLAGYFNDVNASHGLSTPVGPDSPRTVDLTTPGALDEVSSFATAVLDKVADWTPERLAAEAEEQLAQAPDTRGRPLTFQHASGWRAILGTADGFEPAKEAAEWFAKALAPEYATWYEDLATAWQSGGRAAALQFLQDSRTAAIDSLKLR